MATLYETLDGLCKEKGIKGGRMCTDLGFSKSLMTDLKSGRKKGVNAETAQKIASYFGVSVGYLLGEEEKGEKKEQPIVFDGLSKKQKSLINKVMQMSDAELDRFDKILSLVENAE
jgi:transcriptional regulator with XRE-family HTH domain